jgi:hypothetical protein
VTESEWLLKSDPTSMVEFLRKTRKLSKRKRLLFGVACCHRIRHLLVDDRSVRAIEVAEPNGMQMDSQLTKSYVLHPKRLSM